MKITGQPHRKACKLNFYWKICGGLFSSPLQGSKMLRAPFCIRPPSVCERSLIENRGQHAKGGRQDPSVACWLSLKILREERVMLFTSVVIMSYSSYWITLLLCTSAPLVLWYDRFDCGSRQVKRDQVHLVTKDYDITLCWPIGLHHWHKKIKNFL